jgi:histidine triad (HIT) family protein
MRTAKSIGWALQRGFNPRKVGLMIAGLEVPHVHLHVLPIDDVHDLDFANADPHPDPAALDEAAAAVRGALREMGRAEASD